MYFKKYVRKNHFKKPSDTLVFGKNRYKSRKIVIKQMTVIVNQEKDIQFQRKNVIK